MTGVDLSKEELKIAKEENSKSEFLKADLRKLPFKDEVFDGVWAHASLLHLEKDCDVEKALSEFNRVLKSGGILHILVIEKGSVKRASEERFFHYFDKGELRVIVEMAGFLIEKMYHYPDSLVHPERKLNINWLVCLAKKW